MPKPVFFDLPSAQRIARVVQRFVPPSNNLAGKRIARIPLKQFIWAKITSSADVSGVRQHAWTQQQRTATGWEDAPEALTGTTTLWFAIAPDLGQIPDDTIVAMEIDFLDDDTSIFTAIEGGGGGGNFQVVNLVGDGGSNGTNKTTAPTRTYTVKSWDNSTTFGTAVPLISTHDNRKLKVHRADATYGLAVINSDGTVDKLVDVFDEYPDEQDCS